MSNSTQFPSEERPFALRFHGFVEDGPHAVRRFTSFCTADLNLSAEETGRILAQPGSAVICWKESPDDLSSLVDAFQELGVRVSISDRCDNSALSAAPPVGELAEITPQLEELLRAPSLRMIQSSSTAGDYVLALNEHSDTHEPHSPAHAPVTPSITRAHQNTRTGRSHPRHHRGALADANPIAIRQRRSRSIRLRTAGRRQTGLTGIQMIGLLIAGLACLIGINRAFIGKPDLSGAPSRYKLATSWGIAPTQRLTTEGQNSAPLSKHTHYDGTVSRNGYALTLSSRMHDGGLSARVLMVTPRNAHRSLEQADEKPQLRRAESDTTLLREEQPGVWTGALVTYLFIEHGGEMLRVPAQTQITLRMDKDGHSAHGTVALTGIVPTPLQSLQNVPGIAHAVTDQGLSLKLSDRVLLRTTSVSF